MSKIVKKIKEPTTNQKSSVKYPEHTCKNKEYNVNNKQNKQNEANIIEENGYIKKEIERMAKI